MTSPSISLAFSPCPNDTFIFNALVNGILPDPGFNLAQVDLADVETLNRRALEGKYDVTKLSFHAYGHVSGEYELLSAGAALGRGCGPLLVAKDPNPANKLNIVAIPGRYTTAAMLLKLYLPEVETVEVPFEQIMATVKNGTVDAGVIIHESRFTYKGYGLHMLKDLGTWWETRTSGPIPLGGIAIKKSLGQDLFNKVNGAIRASLKWARNHQHDTLPYIREHSQELEEQVISDHIALYVNNYSEDLGAEGRQAVRKFMDEGHLAGLF